MRRIETWKPSWPSAPHCSPFDSAATLRPLPGKPPPGASRLGGLAHRLRDRIRRSRRGGGGRLGRGHFPALLPVRRPSDRGAARGRVATPRRPALGGPARSSLRRARRRGRPRSSTHRGCGRHGDSGRAGALDFFPARLLAVLGNSLGTRRRSRSPSGRSSGGPSGNGLILAGIVVAAAGKRGRRAGRGPERCVHRRRGGAPLCRLRHRQRLPDAAEETLEELFQGLVLGRALVGDILAEVGEHGAAMWRSTEWSESACPSSSDRVRRDRRPSSSSSASGRRDRP